eukprot:COSAG01_NODE_5954_length_3937_cov_7.762376_2_plen_54_part_00
MAVIGDVVQSEVLDRRIRQGLDDKKVSKRCPEPNQACDDDLRRTLNVRPETTT